MGFYNPHVPHILGEEWVGIRDEDVVFDPTLNTVEMGHRFTITGGLNVGNVRAYMHDTPVETRGQVIAASIYAAGTSEESGPIIRTVVPVASAVITGNGAGHGSSISIFGAGSATEALLTPSLSKGLTWTYGISEFRWVKCLFDISRYASQFNGKRILGMNWLYAVSASDLAIETDPLQNYGVPNSVGNTSLVIGTDTQPNGGTDYLFMGRILAKEFGVIRQPLGELNYWFNNQNPTVSTSVDRMNWNYAEMLRLAPGAALPITATFIAGDFITNASMFMYYTALEVFSCEERRVAYGAVQVGSNTSGSKGQYFPGEVIPITVRSPATMGAQPALSAGTYDVMLSSAAIISVPTYPHGFPVLNALRQLYEIPTHPLVMTQLPVPLDETAVGRTFVSAQTDIVPQVSVHTTGGTLVEPHAYGRQAAARVYSGVVAEQEIFDDPVGVATTYHQVRFYTRRFGDTTSPIVITGLGGLPGTASLTPTEWDALPSLIDGWKEVTLRLNPATVMGNVVSPTWRWQSSEANPGNRWEVLGVIAPAITALPSNELNLVAAPNRAEPATYGAPANGAAVSMLWLPGYAPQVTAATDDPSTDAVLIFSQDPPTITGVTISTLSQSVTGFVECVGKSVCCVPSAIQYNRVTWSPTTLPTTGFGAYELQRYDAVGGVWQTIMLATTPTVTGFNDYEPRVGVTSSYQIRQLNVLDFFGSWSVTGTGTITAPGVTLPSCGTNKRGVLIFTTNEVQSGLNNLAYAMVWEDQIREEFTFLEAGNIQFSQQHGRDYQVAFHGTERGGETFTRELLLSNAAVALPRLGNMRSLRDMAWDDTSYVCVRDDIGDRWFASIIVPDGVVRRNRRLYNATITVVEVTATPSPVNP